MAHETITKDYESLRDELKHLRSDVATLAESLVATTKERAGAAKTRAVEAKDSAIKQARHRLEQLSSQTQAACGRGHEAVETVERHVAAHPCKSLSIAFGIGLFLGGMLTWRTGSGRR